MHGLPHLRHALSTPQAPVHGHKTADSLGIGAVVTVGHTGKAMVVDAVQR